MSADAQPTKAQEQITFRFCRECSNMLYPKEDRMTNKLMFACRTCQFSEEAISSCVFRNNMYNTVGETAGVTQDVGSDPTVGDPDPDVYPCCTLCGMELGEEGWWEEDMWNAKEHEGKEMGMNVTVFDLNEMSHMEDEDDEMDGEPDTTGDDREMIWKSGGERGDAKERCGERISHSSFPERKTS
ncbi:MAG: hypothetical protein Q9161_000845 [Pseudevernia consocians]